MGYAPELNCIAIDGNKARTAYGGRTDVFYFRGLLHEVGHFQCYKRADKSETGAWRWVQAYLNELPSVLRADLADQSRSHSEQAEKDQLARIVARKDFDRMWPRRHGGPRSSLVPAQPWLPTRRDVQRTVRLMRGAWRHGSAASDGEREIGPKGGHPESPVRRHSCRVSQ